MIPPTGPMRYRGVIVVDAPLRRSFLILCALAAAGGCRDGTAPPKPVAIAIVAGDAQTGTAGRPLATSPTFVVNDESGHPIAGVAVAISVSAGNGALTGAPTKTGSGPTAVGTWSLGPKVGANRLTIAVDGLPPATITSAAAVGPAAKIVLPSAPPSGRVAETIAPAPVVTLTDAFDNPIAGAVIAVAYSPGAQGPATLTTDAAGTATIAGWTLGTVAGSSTATLTSGAATATLVATALPADPVQLAIASGDRQQGKAGATLAAPVVFRLTDHYGNPVGGRDASLSVTRGGGSVTTTVTSAADGTIATAWTLGRTAEPQLMHVAVGALTADASASVLTDFNIELRFFGSTMSAEDLASFSNAAARLTGLVTGDIPDVAVDAQLESECGIRGLPEIHETIDDVVIYAAVESIDGAGGILAQAGPCLFRSAASGSLTAVGVLSFDVSDVAGMRAQGILQDVLTHEMLHVLGIGSLWSPRSLLFGEGTPNVGYVGPVGRAGCTENGGSVVCAANVPVENNGVLGTSGVHWRESVFRTELMTGYVNAGGMPLSAITAGSLTDLGYVVNPFAIDPFHVPEPAVGDLIPGRANWERLIRPRR